MPYAPGIQSLPLGGVPLTTGQSWGNAYASVGESLGRGIQQWFQNDANNNKMKAATMGIIAQDPSILQQFTDPIAQKALTKVKDGSASAKDILVAYGATTAAKQQRTEMLQNQFIKAQMDDLASQARLRSTQANIAERNYNLVNSIFGGSMNGGSGTPQGGSPQSGAPQGNPLVPPGQPAQAGMAQPAPPTLKDSTIELIRGTGQMPDSKTAADYHAQKLKIWNDVSRPAGYVQGAEEMGPNNTPVVNWYPVSRTNGGTVTRQNEPIKMPKGIAPPGVRLDPSNYTPIAPAPQANPNASPIMLSKEAQDELKTTTNELAVLQEQKQKLQNLKALNQNLDAHVSSRFAPIAGSEHGKVILNAMGNDAPMRFDAQAAPLYSDILDRVKNIRNFMEFNAVTGAVPKAEQSAGTRADTIGTLEDAIDTGIAIRTKAADLIRAGAVPASALAAARSPENVVVHKIFNRPSEFASAVQSGAIKPGTRVSLEGVAGSVGAQGDFVPDNKPKAETPEKQLSAQEIFDRAMKRKKK